MSENAKKFVQNLRLILIVFIIEKLFDMVNMTWAEALIPLYILIIFYVAYLIKEFWKS